ncbi:MAG: hypothetical protein KKF48_05025 [Nanoarchaeota archaeon]|nr:hypothetical protein [Nanoarchaeota archaeon]MBU1028380.1 hypothetical protein [Nanoarchaeota archaeon]
MKLKIIFLLSLIIFLSGNLVSAVCCQKTINNQTCQNDVEENCDNKYSTSPNLCEETDFCTTGYCFNPATGLCSTGGIEADCESPNKWGESEGQCEEGCCVGGSQTHFTTAASCDILSRTWGIEAYINWNIPESECVGYSDDEGACIIGNECVFISEVECSARDGSFYKGLFCSSEKLEADYGYDYEEKSHKSCVEGKEDVYWFDSNENKEGVAEDCELYEETCDINSRGEYFCKSLNCFDEVNNKERINGETWCVFDAYVGNGLDIPGSEHYLASCNYGEIEITRCGNYRNKICGEKIVDGVSRAKCRTNYWENCFEKDVINNKAECEKLDDCRWFVVDMEKKAPYNNFKLGGCVPKYPRGFNVNSEDSSETGNGKNVCNLASATATLVYEKTGPLNLGAWKCKEGSDESWNCLCEEEIFVIDMNTLCMSLGDCGVHVNLAGEASGNIYLAGKYTRPSFDVNDPLNKPIVEGYFNLSKNKVGENIANYTSNKYNSVSEIGNFAFPPLPPQETMIFGKEKTTKFGCLPWQPVSGGEDCDLCNENPMRPCTKYKCESLGAGCKLLTNSYEDENPICYDASGDDAKPPQIMSFEIQGEYRVISEENGVKIKKQDGGCIQEYTTVNFSFTTHEPAVCKWDKTRFQLFKNGQELFEKGYSWETTHSLLNYKIKGQDEFNFYVICQDPYDNPNAKEYAINFCIDPVPDISPPVITKSLPLNASYLKKDTSNLSLDIYLDEPSKCRYEKVSGISYENMVNEMICNDNNEDAFEHRCSKFIDELTENKNNIYIKCINLANLTMNKDYSLTFFATQEALKIDSVSPLDQTIKGPINIELEVITSGGAYDGKSNCSYRFLGKIWKDVFPDKDSTTHKYTFTSLDEGSYDIEITCKDAAENIATALTNIIVEVDKTAPTVIRAYYQDNKLKIITNEIAECYYNDNNRCNPFNFSSDRKITNIGLKTEHFAEWLKGQTYYIKCIDVWDNSNKNCAAIIRMD